MAGTNRRYHAARCRSAPGFCPPTDRASGNLIKIIVGEFAPLLPQ